MKSGVGAIRVLELVAWRWVTWPRSWQWSSMAAGALLCVVWWWLLVGCVGLLAFCWARVRAYTCAGLRLLRLRRVHDTATCLALSLSIDLVHCGNECRNIAPVRTLDFGRWVFLVFSHMHSQPQPSMARP